MIRSSISTPKIKYENEVILGEEKMFLKKIAEKYAITAAQRYFTGDPLESGGTSIQGQAAPALRNLEKSGAFEGAKKILDYGAGKYGRNAKFLRDKGYKVYAYDPFNGKDKDGWTGVSPKLPANLKFDVGFTSFVLNVVPKKIEKSILTTLATKIKGATYHIVRNMDVFKSVKSALERGEKIVTEFYKTKYKGKGSPGKYTDEDIMNFCIFGVQTSKGFQRITELKGHKLLKTTEGYKVYQK